ncbi:MAG: TIGR03936 family radical SAM-associated protein [Chloroflexota bacterium]
MSAVQRLRFTFNRGETAMHVGHLDLARLWERALRRAGLPVAYSSGFTPHARVAFAAPLAVGLTAGAELVDVYMSETVPPEEAAARLDAQLPEGLTIRDAVEVERAAPSLGAQLRAADYRVTFAEPVPGLASAVADLLAAPTLPHARYRDGKLAKSFDLRPFIFSLASLPGAEPAGLAMRLRLDSAGGARPDEVLAALGLAERPARLHRECLLLADEAAA